MVTLTEFLLARIAEDEAAANEAARSAETGSWEALSAELPAWTQEARDAGDSNWFAAGKYLLWETESSSFMGGAKPPMVHIARHDPARVLAECAAHIQIVERCDVALAGVEPGSWLALLTLSLLALPYSDHPQFQPEWRV